MDLVVIVSEASIDGPLSSARADVLRDPRMTNTDESIDFKQVEKEFAAAVAHDTKYQRENDAKFRAIHQKVGSYEEFRLEFLHFDVNNRSQRVRFMPET